MKTIQNTINTIEANTNINIPGAIAAIAATGLTYLAICVLFAR
jgi:hypothetical protein